MGPRIAPVCPVIADKVRSYGGGIPYLPVPCRSGPCPRFARRARSYRGMAWVGWRRILSANRAGTSGHRGQGPTVPGSTAFRRMALSEAIPITTAAWVSQAQPILRRAPRRKTVAPTTVLPGSVGRITVRGYTPIVGAGPARDSRAGRAPTGEWRGRGCVGADLIRESRRSGPGFNPTGSPPPIPPLPPASACPVCAARA